MTIKALLTTALLLGTSSLALARPATLADGQVRDHRTPTVLAAPPVVVAQAPRTAYPRDFQDGRDFQDHHDRQDDRDFQGSRDDRRDRQGGRFQRHVAPVVLSSAAHLDRGRAVIALPQTRPLRSLVLQATGGKTKVRTIEITFANGRTQLVDANVTLTGSATYAIDLTGDMRQVTGLTVFGKSGRRASFQVLGA